MYRTILVPLDGSVVSRGALGTAGRLARDLGADLVLMTASVPARVPGIERDLAVQLGETDAEVALAEAAASRELGGLSVTRVVVTGRLAECPAEAILGAAQRAGAGLLVMATHGRSGVLRAILGSVADAVVARSPVPVLLIPSHRSIPDDAHAAPRAARLIVALDGSPEAEAALPPAAALSAGLGVPIDLARVVPDAEAVGAPDEPQLSCVEMAATYLEAAAQRLHRAGVPARRIRSAVLQAKGRTTANTLLAYAEESHAQMLVIATHARHGVRRLLHGSVEADAVAHATLPVLVVRIEAPAVSLDSQHSVTRMEAAATSQCGAA